MFCGLVTWQILSHGILDWFGDMEKKAGDDWVKAGQNMMVNDCRGRGREPGYNV